MVKKIILMFFELIDGNSDWDQGPTALPSSIKRLGLSVRLIRALEMRPMSLQKTSR